MRRLFFLCLLCSITGCQSWSRFWDVGLMGGSVTGVYSPVTAKLNGGEDTVTVNRRQTGYSFGKSIMPGNAFQIAVSTETFAQSCMVDNASGIATAGNNRNDLYCVNAFYGFYGTATGEQFNGAAASRDGGVVLTAGTAGDFVYSSAVPGPVAFSHSGGGIGDILALKLNGLGEVAWYNYFGINTTTETAAAIASTADGGYVILGTTGGNVGNLHGIPSVAGITHGGGADLFVLKISASGALEWHTTSGSAATEAAHAISVAPDGSIYLLGSGNNGATFFGLAPGNAHAGTNDMYLIKLNANGTAAWVRFIGGGSSETGVALAALPDGVFVAGTTTGGPVTNSGGTQLNTPPGATDGVLLRVNASGVTLWHSYIGAGGATDTIGGVRLTKDGGFIVSGTAAAALNLSTFASNPSPILSYSAANDIYALKLTSIGQPVWLTYLGGVTGETGGPVTETYDAGYVVTGIAGASFTLTGATLLNSYNAGNDIIQVKLTSSGTVEWYQFLGSTLADSVASVIETADRGIVTAGFFGAAEAGLKGLTQRNNYSGGTSDGFVMKVNSKGGI